MPTATTRPPQASRPFWRRAPERAERCAHCYACGHAFGVGHKALTARCPRCAKGLNLRDITIERGCSLSSVETCGRLRIGRRATLLAKSIVAVGGVTVEGRLEGSVTCRGTVRIGKRARWKGDCAAGALVVEPGALIEGGRFRVGAPSEPREPGTE